MDDTQLRSTVRVIRWAIRIASIVARIERIKHLARAGSSLPASVEFAPDAIQTKIILKREHTKRAEQIPHAMPTVAQITLWLAELGDTWD